MIGRYAMNETKMHFPCLGPSQLVGLNLLLCKSEENTLIFMCSLFSRGEEIWG